MPPGVDPALYQQALAYLRANPDAAQQTAEQVITWQCADAEQAVESCNTRLTGVTTY